MSYTHDYRNLDPSGEAAQAAERMEARAREPASAALYDALVAPLLVGRRKVLEVGCGTAWLSRRIAAAEPAIDVLATDKSEGMLAAARALGPQVRLARWDATDEAAFPEPGARFGLILCAVTVPYLETPQVADLVRRLRARLEPRGVLAFVEQDLLSETLAYPAFELARRVLDKDHRDLRPHMGVGLLPLLRAAGLALLPVSSFYWTDTNYGAYTRTLLQRAADDARRSGRIDTGERARFLAQLETLAASGDFHYGLVYHRVAGA